MSPKPKPRDDVSGKFLPTRNPRSERVYLTVDEWDFIQAMRKINLTPHAAILHLNRFFNFKQVLYRVIKRARQNR